MTLSIRWKVTIGALLVLACGLLIARELVVRSLDQQEIVQSGLILEARDRKSTRLNSSHERLSRMPSSA